MMGHYKHAQKLPTLADSKLELGQGNVTFGSRSSQNYGREVYFFYNNGWKTVPVKGQKVRSYGTLCCNHIVITGGSNHKQMGKQMSGSQ